MPSQTSSNAWVNTLLWVRNHTPEDAVFAVDSRYFMDTGTDVHGFRSSFRDWAGEKTEYPDALAEIALAHSVGAAIQKAYKHGDALDRRRPMMERHCPSLPDGRADLPSHLKRLPGHLQGLLGLSVPHVYERGDGERRGQM